MSMEGFGYVRMVDTARLDDFYVGEGKDESLDGYVVVWFSHRWYRVTQADAETLASMLRAAARRVRERSLTPAEAPDIEHLDAVAYRVLTKKFQSTAPKPDSPGLG